MESGMEDAEEAALGVAEWEVPEASWEIVLG